VTRLHPALPTSRAECRPGPRHVSETSLGVWNRRIWWHHYRSWGHFGGILVAFWSIFCPFWDILGTFWWHFGPLLAPSGAFWGHFGGILSAIRLRLTHRGTKRSRADVSHQLAMRYAGHRLAWRSGAVDSSASVPGLAAAGSRASYGVPQAASDVLQEATAVQTDVDPTPPPISGGILVPFWTT